MSLFYGNGRTQEEDIEGNNRRAQAYASPSPSTSARVVDSGVQVDSAAATATSTSRLNHRRPTLHTINSNASSNSNSGKTSEEHTYDAHRRSFIPNLWTSAARANLSSGKLKHVSLAQIMAGDTCPPLSLPDFEGFLTYCDYSLENLLFVVWYQDYRKRYETLFSKCTSNTTDPSPSHSSSSHTQPRFASDKRFKSAFTRLLRSSHRTAQNHNRRNDRPNSDAVRLLPLPPVPPIPSSPSYTPTTPITPVSATPLVSKGCGGRYGGTTAKMSYCGTSDEPREHRSSYVGGGGDRDGFDIDLGLMADGRAVFPDELGVEGLFYTPEKYKYDYSIASTSASASVTRTYHSNSTRTPSSRSKPNRTSTSLSVQTSLSPLAPLSSASSSSSPSSPTSPPTTYHGNRNTRTTTNKKPSSTNSKSNPHPPQNQNTKPGLLLEVQHILATFLLPSAPRELLLDGHVRDAVVARVARDGKAGVVSGPDVFKPIYDATYDLLESVSLPRFLAHAATNINRPKQLYWYAWGITNTFLGILYLLLVIFLLHDRDSPSWRSRTRLWRLPASPWIGVGVAQWYSAWRGYCSQLFLRKRVQVRAWEMEGLHVDVDVDDEEVGDGEREGDGDGDGRASGGGKPVRTPLCRVAPFLSFGSDVVSQGGENPGVLDEKEEHEHELEKSSPLSNNATLSSTRTRRTTSSSWFSRTSTLLSSRVHTGRQQQDAHGTAEEGVSRGSVSRCASRTRTSSISSSTSSTSFDSPSFPSHHHQPSFPRPPIFGPERVVEDPRILAVHRRVLFDVLSLGFAVMGVVVAVVLCVPGPHGPGG